MTKYLYDAENHRIGVIRNAGSDKEVTVKYVVDTASGDLSQVLAEKRIYTRKDDHAEEDSETIYYFYGDNRLVAQESATGSQTPDEENRSDEENTSDQSTSSEYLIYHFNHIGSTTALT